MNLHSGSRNEFVVVVVVINASCLLAVLMEGCWFANNGLFFPVSVFVLFFPQHIGILRYVHS